MNNIFYKVVYETLELNLLVSAIARPPAEVIYKFDRWVSASHIFASKGYHLTVFDSLKSAMLFMSQYDCLSVYQCKIEGSIEELPLFGEIGSRGKIFSYDNKIVTWPRGTMMVRRVMLIGII